MAKPIPPNKRWLTESNNPSTKKTRTPPRIDPLIEILEQMVESPRRAEGGRVRPRLGILRHGLAHARRRLGPTIIARYEGVCHACQEAIVPGQSITLHPELRWVHTDCAYEAEHNREEPLDEEDELDPFLEEVFADRLSD